MLVLNTWPTGCKLFRMICLKALGLPGQNLLQHGLGRSLVAPPSMVCLHDFYFTLCIPKPQPSCQEFGHMTARTARTHLYICLDTLLSRASLLCIWLEEGGQERQNETFVTTIILPHDRLTPMIRAVSFCWFKDDGGRWVWRCQAISVWNLEELETSLRQGGHKCMGTKRVRARCGSQWVGWVRAAWVGGQWDG